MKKGSILVPHYNWWGPPGNGKTTIEKYLQYYFGDAAFFLKKDTTGLRQAEGPGYRLITPNQMDQRVLRGHYMYAPTDIYEAGEVARTALPLPRYSPNVPPGKEMIFSTFPPEAIPLIWESGEVTSILLYNEDIKVTEKRLRRRCRKDGSNFAFKMLRNQVLRDRWQIESRPEVFNCIVFNDGSIANTLEQFAGIIPGLQERMKKMKRPNL